MNQRLLLLLMIFVAFVMADGPEIIMYPPYSMHQWRQSDCVSYAKTYYQRNSGFFEPRNYNLLGIDGRVASEFPIIYYIQAKLAHIFGFQYWLLRGSNFLLYLVGLVYLFGCIKFWIKDYWLAAAPVLILATTPYYYFYGVNFLPNVPAISLSFVGLYYLLRYEQLKSLRYLITSSSLFLMASLLKPTDGALIWLAYLACAFVNLLARRQKLKELRPLIIGTIIIGIGVFSWYSYVNWYNHKNLNLINLVGIYPIWGLSYKDILVILTVRMGNFWLSIYQHIYLLYITAILFIIYVVKWKSLDQFLRLFTLFLLLGTFVYSILWYNAFMQHDYYQLIFVIPAVFICVTVLEYYVRKTEGKLNKFTRHIVPLILLGMVGLSYYNNGAELRARWANREYTSKFMNVFEAEPFLRKLGVAPDDIVISIPDNSPNITLMAYGNRGYTTLFLADWYTLEHFDHKGARYLIVNDTIELRNPIYKPYTSKLLGVYKDIYVYDLR